MIRYVEGVAISRIACALPKQNFSLMEYAPNLFDEKSARRIAKGTGFSRLRVVPENMTAADLCTAAAERILREIDRSKIGSLIFVTQTPDYALPATSHVLQDRLHLNNDVLCLDINEGCTGWVAGLYTAAVLCKNTGRLSFLLAGDTLTTVTSPNDRSTRSIIGDAGTATLIVPSEGRIPFLFKSYGEYSQYISMANYYQWRRHHPTLSENDLTFTLDGGAITDFALDDLPATVGEFLEKEHLRKDDISLYACHQANKLLLISFAHKLGVPIEKVPFTSSEIGNEGVASIPLVLTNQAKEADLSQVLCCGFGVGMAIGICLADFSQTYFGGIAEI